MTLEVKAGRQAEVSLSSGGPLGALVSLEVKPLMIHGPLGTLVSLEVEAGLIEDRQR